MRQLHIARDDRIDPAGADSAVRTDRNARRGAAAVELAIVLPVLMGIALASTDFGRIISAYLVVSNAARAGAEYGASNRFTSFSRGSWETQVNQAAAQELQNLASYSAANQTIALTTTTDSQGEIQVSVNVTYQFQMIVSWIGLPSTVVLRHQVLMRQYR